MLVVPLRAAAVSAKEIVAVNLDNGRTPIIASHTIKALPRPAQIFQNSKTTSTRLLIDQQLPLTPLERYRT
jgi:hypothetical protein